MKLRKSAMEWRGKKLGGSLWVHSEDRVLDWTTLCFQGYYFYLCSYINI